MTNQQVIEQQVAQEGFVELPDYITYRDYLSRVLDNLGDWTYSLQELVKEVIYEDEDGEPTQPYMICMAILEQVQADGAKPYTAGNLTVATYDLENAIDKEDYAQATSILQHIKQELMQAH